LSREHARPACRNADTTRLFSRVHGFALAHPGLDAFDQDHAAPRRAKFNDQIDAEYRQKYRQHGARYVDPMVAPTARATTIKLVPRQQQPS
jgi:Uncharacterized protein conserved in bacteria (DUF2255)